MSKFEGKPMMDARGYLKPREVQRIIDSTNNERDRLLLKTLWIAGPRVSEIVGLRAQDAVDGRNHTDIGLTPSKLLKEENAIVLDTLKRTSKDPKNPEKRVYKPQERVVPVPPAFIRELSSYVMKSGIGKDELIFNISRHRVFQIVQEASERAGVKAPGRAKRVHPHHFRHSHCIAYIKKNNSMDGLKHLQRRLNHASIMTTGHYLQYAATGEHKRIEEIFG